MVSTNNLIVTAVVILAIILALYYLYGRGKTEGLGCDANMYTAAYAQNGQNPRNRPGY